MNILHLRCQLLAEPRGIDARQPLLSWELSDPAPGSSFQKARRIVVASTREGAAAGTGDLWDSGWIEDGRTSFIEYAGHPLESRMECFWKVICRDESGAEISSEVASWTMGLLEKSDWAARWIGLDTMSEFPADMLVGARWIWNGDSAPGERVFEKTFTLPEACDGELWGLADDAAEVEINGQPIAQLDRAQATFNIFPLPLGIPVNNLRKGENTVVVRASKRHDRDPYGGVILRLVAGGREVIEEVRVPGVDFVPTTKRRLEGGITVVTDATWTCRGKAVEDLGSFGAQPWHLQRTDEYPNLPARYLRREFKAPAPVQKAVLYFSGLGLSEAVINGQRIGQEELSPHATDYAKTVFYRTFDVTGLVREGDNAVGCILGNGRYFAPRIRVPFPMESYGCPKLLLQLEITHADGTTTRVVSDSTWKISADGAIGWNNEFDGEHYDARKDDPAWALPGYDDARWGKVQPVAAPQGNVRAQTSNPIHKSAIIPAVETWTTKYGTRMFDFGVNLVGWCRGRIHGAGGRKLTIRFAEELESRDALSLENLRSAQCADHVILKDGLTEFEPKFIYHGFRYVEVRGEADSVELEACFVHDEVPEAGLFTCSNDLVNRIVDAAARGIRGNYRSMPTDCPQRDERMGWLGDRAGGAPGEMFLYDVAGLYRKWMGDIREAQGLNGSIPDIAPAFWRMYSDNVTWPSCLPIIPYWLHRHYGDTDVLKETFPAIERWLDLMCGYLEDGLMPRDIYGDWCVPPETAHLIHSERADRKTAATILASTYLAKNLGLAAGFARLLGRNDLAEKWSARREEIAAALNARYFDPAAGSYDNGSQTAALLPLAFELVPEENRRKVFDYLVSRINESGRPALGTGLIGGQWLMRTLTKYGRADIAAALVCREDYPSWGYMIRNGATTIWELWNGDTAEPHMNSRNHVMLLGDLLTWLFEDVAGIQPREPGFSRIGLRPHFVFESAACTHRTIRGPVSSAWKTTGQHIEWTVNLPPNVNADVELPAGCAASLEIDDVKPALREISTDEGPLLQTLIGPGTHVLRFESSAAIP
jgi:alpha-L-rhamnosidase